MIVVGAGLSGLAASRRLQAAGRSVTVLEASDGAGGRVRTDTVDGWLLDRGFQVFDTGYPEPKRLFTPSERATWDLRELPNAARVRLGDTFHRVGDPRQQPKDALTTLLAPIGSVRDKAALGALLLRVWSTKGDRLLDRPERTALENFRAAGLSDAVIDRLLRPFLAGVVLEDELTTSSRFVELVLRSFARGRQTLPAAGIGALPATLASGLDDVRFEVRVDQVKPREVVANGERITAEAVIVAVDPPAASDLVPALGAAPRMRSVTTAYFAADRSPTGGDGSLCIGPGPLTNAVTLTDSVSTYGPAGRSLISVSTLEPDLTEGAMRGQLAQWFGPAVADWELIRRYDIAAALPAADPPMGRLRRPVRIEAGLYVCGDHRDSPSQQGALVSGRRAADAVLSDQPPQQRQRPQQPQKEQQ